MAKKYTVTTYDYDDELGRTVTIDYNDFWIEEEAFKYASSIEHSISSRTVIRGNYGYDIIATGSRRTPIKPIIKNI